MKPKLRKIFTSGNWLLSAAILGCFIFAAGGFRYQPLDQNYKNFAWSELHCWVHPCLINQTLPMPWQRHGALPFPKPVAPLAVTSQGIFVTVHDDGRGLIWTSEGDPRGELRLPKSTSVTAIAVGPEKTIVTGHDDGRVLIWTPDGELRDELRLPFGTAVTAVAVGPDDTIITANDDGEVFVWTLEGELRDELRLPFGTAVTAVAVGPDDTIITANDDGEVFVWILEGELRGDLKLPFGTAVTAVAVGPGDTIITADDDGEVFLWAIEGNLRSKLRSPLGTRVTAVAMGPDDTIITGNNDGQVLTWTGEGELRDTQLLNEYVPAITVIAIAPNRTIVPVLSEGRGLLRTVEGDLIGELHTSPPAPVTAVAVGRDNIIVTAHDHGQAILWTAEGSLIRKLTAPSPAPATAIAVGPNDTIATGYDDGKVLLWTPEHRQIDTLYLPSGGPVKFITVENDNAVVAAGSDNAMYRLLGLITPALWTWTTLVFAILGLVVLVRTSRTPKERSVETAPLESDRPVNDPKYVTESTLDFVESIASVLSDSHTARPLTLCLDGQWGSGKTSIITLVSQKLRGDCTCVFFDAWHHQNENHLFAALMEQIRKSWNLRRRPTWSNDSTQTLPLRVIVLERIKFYVHLWLDRIWCAPISFIFFFALFLFSTIVALVTIWPFILSAFGTQCYSFGEFECQLNPKFIPLFIFLFSGSLGLSLFLWNSPWNVLKAFAVTPVSLITASSGWFTFTQSADQLSFRYRFQKSFQEVCSALDSVNRRLVIIIDDLDRCEREHILEVLEAVDYLASSGSCLVLLTMDEERVKNTLDLRHPTSAQQQFPSEKFLKKIINLTVRIPPIDSKELSVIRKSEQI